MFTSSVERSWRRRLRLDDAVAPPLDPALVVDPEGIWWDDAGDGGAAMPSAGRWSGAAPGRGDLLDDDGRGCNDDARRAKQNPNAKTLMRKQIENPRARKAPFSKP